MIWNDRLRQLRIDNRMTLKEIAKRLDISEAMASRHETSTKSIPYETIEQYARIYGSTPEFIMGWDKPMRTNTTSSALSPEELDIIGAYRDLSEEGKDMVCGMLHVKRDGAGQEGQNMNAG